MEQKLDLIILLLKECNQKIDNVEEKLTIRMDNIKEELTIRMDNIKEELTVRMDKIEEELTVRMDKIEEELTVKIDNIKEELTVRVDGVEKDLHSLASTVSRLEIYVMEKVPAALDGWKAHLETQEEIKKDVTILKGKVENHSIRISALEDALEA